jgi:uncharacterized protein YyaL (SSP411 family)
LSEGPPVNKFLTMLLLILIPLLPHGVAMMTSPTKDESFVNHLEHERSEYLRQHRTNPIDWYPWGDAALTRARELDRPIFLSIGYASCHWCHVMEHEVFEHEDVAAFMNEHFVSIKVDREERPDIDAVYMDAVQAMTGNGGWPLSAFLTPDLEPFFGATYIPKDQFLELTERIVRVWGTDPGSLRDQGRKVRTLLEQARGDLRPAALGADVVPAAVRRALDGADTTWGGFRTRTKFPTPARWSFLLHRYRRTGEEALAVVLRRTLDRMADGGLQDQIGGGFHRYTVEPTWVVPHFEKMLYDNAQLATLYTEASRVFGAPHYERVARRTLDFLLREMRDPDGAFYASFDADSGGVEGSYYVWSPQEVIAIAGPDAGPAVAMALGISTKGNFEGKSIPTGRVTAADVGGVFGLQPDEVEALVEAWLPALLEARARRVAPGLDRKVVTGWNGLAISALARAGRAFGEPRYLVAAQTAGAWIWQHHRGPGGDLLRVSNGGRAEHAAILDDLAFLADGFLDLFEATGDVVWFLRARELTDRARTTYASTGGGFHLTAVGVETPLGRPFEIYDSVRPSGNAVMLHVMLRVAAVTGDPALREEVSAALAGVGGRVAEAGLDAAWWLDLAELLGGPFYEVVVAGEGAGADALAAVVGRRLAPYAVLLRVGSGGPTAEQLKRFPVLEGKRSRSGEAVAYVCTFGSCKRPTPDPMELERQILMGWAR